MLMSKPSTFAKRLRELLDENNMTQSELAKRTGISKSSISRYLKGDWEAKQDAVYSIAKTTNVSEAWLMGYDVPKERQFPLSPSNVVSLPNNVGSRPGFVKKPRLGTIACGKPILAVEEAEEFDEVPDWVECDFTLRCKGDSMINARIYDGDTVYIRSQPEVENGEIAAVRVDDEATLKRVMLYPDKIVLEAANPMYEPLVYRGEEMNDVQIMGKAIAFTSMIR